MRAGYYEEIFDEINKAWLAAFLDGEGCLSIKNITSKRIWRLEISNTNYEVIRKISKLTRCGSISKISGINYKWQYTWEVNRKSDIHYILKYILPYLIIKRKKAVMAIKMIENEKYTSLTCPQCNYTWRYFGRATYPTCPDCNHRGTFFGMKDRDALIYHTNSKKRNRHNRKTSVKLC